MAQQQGGELKQMAITQKQIDGAIAAQKDMEALTAKMQPNAKPDPKVLAQIEATAKKNGFASTDEYYTVMDNISLVYGGIDPATKKYVGSEAVIKSQIAEVTADKKMSANDKKQALEAAQPGAEAARARRAEQGQYRSRRGELRQARACHERGSAVRSLLVRTTTNNEKPRRNLRGFFISRPVRSVRSACACAS